MVFSMHLPHWTQKSNAWHHSSTLFSYLHRGRERQIFGLMAWCRDSTGCCDFPFLIPFLQHLRSLNGYVMIPFLQPAHVIRLIWGAGLPRHHWHRAGNGGSALPKDASSEGTDRGHLDMAGCHNRFRLFSIEMDRGTSWQRWCFCKTP